MRVIFNYKQKVRFFNKIDASSMHCIPKYIIYCLLAGLLSLYTLPRYYYIFAAEAGMWVVVRDMMDDD